MTGPAVQADKRATYPAYKPSGVEWLGEVPEHWEVRRLKYSVDRINRKVDGKESDLPYTGLEHIESWTAKRIAANSSATSEGQANLYRRGDVLFGKLRPYLAKVYAAEAEGACTGELLVLRPRAVLQRFLRDYLLNPDFISIVDSSTYGSKMPRANWDFIGNQPMLIPPIDEQRAIAAFLDRETGRIDALIEKKERQIELLQEKRTALISHAVTRGLDPNAPMKDSGVEWLGEYPAHWMGLPLKRCLATKITDGPHETPDLVNEGIDFVSAEAVQGGRINFDARRGFISEDLHQTYCRKCRPQRDDVFLVKSGATTGKLAHVNTDHEFSVWSPLALIRADHRKVLPRFLYAALSADYVQWQIRRTWSEGTQPNIAMGALERLFVAVPPLDEQNGIIHSLGEESTAVEPLITKVCDSIDLLREYRTAMISASVTGKIDVRGEVEHAGSGS